MSNILIVTLEMEEVYQRHFNDLRQQYFPAHANYLDAHITLFHHLPADVPEVTATLATAAQRAAFTLKVAGVVHFGNGVAYRLESPELQALHHALQQAFEPWLIRQDKQSLRPHITVQNKVTAFKAQQLHEHLSASFVPFEMQATGLKTWRYLHGPWKAEKVWPFSDITASEGV
ncbi:2'-5' RNA ligase family protein [Chitinophaga rhizophila]|uniref:2'-5' RNA ligase family protein n=1 Tax=Chitinophaga rhizophila TaxID=2866212 RepID=A0ABS7GHX2_9BACT|nr:2'-5' RNA ligase family protein [Chitinophaga rhizophila]MBW8687021.1 2'-5' RNA ligase family protein [Chitinophaga rhizophila]